MAILFSWALLTLLSNQCRKSRIPLHVVFSEHRAINTAQPSYDNFTGFRFLNGSNTKLPVCVTTQSLVPPPLTCLNYCSCTALPALSALHLTRILKLRRLNHKAHGLRSYIFRSSHLEQPPPRHQTLCYSPFLQNQTLDISLL